MFRSFLSGLVLLGLVAVAGTVSAQGVATLNGQWHVSRAVMNGQAVPDDVLASMMLNVNNSGEFTAESGGLSSNGKFVAASAADQLDVQINAGADSGRALKAKWRMESGALTIAYAQGNYPGDFNSTADNKMLVVYYAAGPRPASSITSNSQNQSTGGAGPVKGTAGPTVSGGSGGQSNTMTIRQ